MSVESINKLSINPFFSAKIIQHFLCGCNGKEVIYPIIFLVLPFILHPESRKKLSNSQSRSTFHTIFLKNNSNKVLISDVEFRIKETLVLTRKALIIGVNEKRFSVAGMIRLVSEESYRDTDSSVIKEYYKAAHQLGNMFTTMSMVEIFRNVGVEGYEILH